MDNNDKLLDALDLIRTSVDALENDDMTKHIATPLIIACDIIEKYLEDSERNNNIN